jgi:DNA-binding transcriptional LysR family regulator
MEFDQLRTFLAVLEQGSFVRAAQALSVSQSTISFHVKALEERVGSSLVERGRGRVGPTPAGRVLEPFARRIVGLCDEANQRLTQAESGEVGELLVAASTIPGEYLLPPILALLRAAHPRLQVQVDVLDTERATAAVLAGDCELALVGRKPGDRRLLATPVGHDEVVLVGPQPDPFVPSGKLAPRDLAQVPVILREQGSGTRDAIARLLPHLGDRNPVLRVGSTEALKRCVLHGLGVAFLSSLAIEAEVEAGRMHRIAITGTPVKRTFYAVRHRSVTPSAGARALHELLVQRNR